MPSPADHLFTLEPAALALVVLRTVVVYAVLLTALRLISGKRELGQMTLFDLVVLLIIANAVQNAMVGTDSSLNGGLLAAVTLLVLDRAAGALGVRSRLAHRLLVGSPTLLVHDGQLVPVNMRREGVAEEDVLQALREHGIEDLADVQAAVLEVDGTISVVPAGTATTRTRRRVRRRSLGPR